MHPLAQMRKTFLKSDYLFAVGTVKGQRFFLSDKLEWNRGIITASCIKQGAFYLEENYV